MKPTIYVDRPIPAEAEAFLAQHCEVKKWEGPGPVPREALLEGLRGAQGLLTSGTRIDEELLTSVPELKAVSTISVGYNHFDIETMKRHSVIGTHTPYVLDETVADLVFALMLGTARRVGELDRYVKEGRWTGKEGSGIFGVDVHHRKLGIIGMGRIGEAVARRARFGFEMEVVYYNRTRKQAAEEKLGVQYAELNELLETSDFVVMLTPLTAGTAGMIGREQFALMKRSAIFINASRGQTIDEEALIEALNDGTILGAGLDVYNEEPLDAAHPFTRMDNVLTLPHLGSATVQTRFDMAMLAARNLVAVLTGGEGAYVVGELG